MPGEKERYSVIWFAEVEPGVFEPLRGEYRCPGGEWTQFGLAPPPLAPLPAGREVQFYWNVSIRRYGYIGPVGGWRDTGVSLRVETVSEFIDYLGQPSTRDNIYEVDANGNETLVASGSNARVWIEKSRYRDNGGPWQDLYDYSQFR